MTLGSIGALAFCCSVALCLAGCPEGDSKDDDKGEPPKSVPVQGNSSEPAAPAAGQAEVVDPLEVVDRSRGSISGTQLDAYRSRVRKAVEGYAGDRAALVTRLAAVADDPTSTHRALLGVIVALESLPGVEAGAALRRLAIAGPANLSDSIHFQAAQAYCRGSRTPEDVRELLNSPVESVRDEALRCMTRWLRESGAVERSLPMDLRRSLADGVRQGGLRNNGKEVATTLSWDRDPPTAAERVDVIAELMERVANLSPPKTRPWEAEAYIDALARLRDGARRVQGLHESAVERMRVLLALALAMQGRTEVRQEMIEALHSEEGRIVLKAIEALRIVGDGSSIPALRQLRADAASTAGSGRSGNSIVDGVDAAIAAIEARERR